MEIKGTKLFDGFVFLGQDFLDKRSRVSNMEQLKGVDPNSIPEGFKIFVQDTKTWYEYDSEYHSEITGNWKTSNAIASMDSDKFVYAILDSEGKVLWGIKVDSTTFSPTIEIGDVVFTPTNVDEFLWVMVDQDNMIVFGIKKDGSLYAPKGMPDEVKERFDELSNIKVLANTDNWLFAFVDVNDTVVWGIQSNGSIYQGKGIPEDALAEFKKVWSRLSDFDNLRTLENTGVWLLAFVDTEDKVVLGITKDGEVYQGKGIPEDSKIEFSKIYNRLAEIKDIQVLTNIDNWLFVIQDTQGNILFGIEKDGSIYQGRGVPEEAKEWLERLESLGYKVMSNDQYLYAICDSNDVVLFAIDYGGKTVVNGITGIGTIEVVDTDQWVYAIYDSKGNILFAIKKDGTTWMSSVDEKTEENLNKINTQLENLNSKIENSEEINSKAINKVMLNGNVGRGYLGNVALQEPGMTDYCIIMMYGQSLSNGSENPAGFNDPVVDGCFMLGDNVWNTTGLVLKELKVGGTVRADGVATGTRQDTIVSTVNAFASLYKKERPWDKNTKFIACSLGVGGRTIAQLSGNMYSDKKNTTRRYPMCNEQQLEDRVRPFFESVKAIADSEGKTVSLSAVFWKQGESDYGTSYIGKTYEEWRDIVVNQETTSSNAMVGSKDAYKKGLTILKEDIFALAKEIFGDAQQNSPVFMPYSVCGTYINNAYQTINDATYEMANEQDNVVQVGPTYVTPDYEGGHLAMNGYRWFGEYCAKALYYVFLKHMDFRPLQPYGFDVKDNKVYIYINPIVPPLRIDTYTIDDIYKNRGFSVRMGTVAQLDANKTMTSGGLLQTITDVSIIENCIVLTCGNIEKFEGAIEVSYAGQGESGYSGHNQGAGNVRDSDTWVAKYNYRNDMSDHGSRRTFNVWTSVRVATESDLTDYEPWDSATTYNYGDMCLITNTTNNVTYLVKSMKDANKNLSPFSSGTTWRTYNLWSGSTKATEEELNTLQYWDAAFASSTGYDYGDKVLFDIIEVDGPVVLTNSYGDAAGTVKNKNIPFGRVNYHTTDVKGNMIIDKPYPMQNWLLNFYKRIIIG